MATIAESNDMIMCTIPIHKMSVVAKKYSAMHAQQMSMTLLCSCVYVYEEMYL